jgi:hypothetical protein
MVIDQNVAMIVVLQVIDQLVAHTEIATRVQVPVRHQIVLRVVHTVTEIHVRHHDQVQIVANVATVQEIHAQALIVQLVVHTVTEIHVRHHDQVQIAESVVTVHVIRVHLQIAHHVHMVIDQNDAMIVVRRMIVQLVVHSVTEIHVRHPDQVQIAQRVVHTVTAIHARLHVRHQIVHHVLMVIDQNAVMIVVPVLIVRVAKTHTVAIVHAQAMIAMPVRRRVTANAVAVQIVPEVVSPMIAKNVHAVALAKSA